MPDPGAIRRTTPTPELEAWNIAWESAPDRTTPPELAQISNGEYATTYGEDPHDNLSAFYSVTG